MIGCDPTRVTVKYSYMLKPCHSPLFMDEPVTLTVKFLILFYIKTNSE
jgi:hypothetical protein